MFGRDQITIPYCGITQTESKAAWNFVKLGVITKNVKKKKKAAQLSIISLDNVITLVFT